MTRFRRVLLGCFTFYLLVFSLIRMEYISYSELSYGAKLYFLVVIFLIELGVIVYSSCFWETNNYIDDVTNKLQIEAYRDTLRNILIISSIGIVSIIIDIILLPRYFFGVYYIVSLVTDLVALVCLTKSLVSYVGCALSV